MQQVKDSTECALNGNILPAWPCSWSLWLSGFVCFDLSIFILHRPCLAVRQPASGSIFQLPYVFLYFMLHCWNRLKWMPLFVPKLFYFSACHCLDFDGRQYTACLWCICLGRNSPPHFKPEWRVLEKGYHGDWMDGAESYLPPAVEH